MEQVLLDTDILSEVLKARDPFVVRRATEYKQEFGGWAISVISVMEVVQGLQKAKRVDALDKFLGELDTSIVLVFDRQCAEIAGRIYGDLERVGQPIGRADPMIAAVALAHNLTLTTGNQGHFERIKALGYPLRLDNWRSRP